MNKFKIGDMVVVVVYDTDGIGESLLGKVGTVVAVDFDGSYLVRIKGMNGHNGNGELTDFDGWYFWDGDLEHLIDDEEYSELIRDLVKKQISQNPVIIYDEFDGCDRFVCPNEDCNGGHRTRVYDGENYCTECGQKLSWGWNDDI